MSRARILLVEDEPGLVLTLGDRLKAEGYEVAVEMDGKAGFARALEGGADLLLLDLMLPGKDGLSICRDLRAGGSRLPILMLTARGEVGDRVSGLRTGADDYLPKPFETAELLARIEAVLRRAAPPGGLPDNADPPGGGGGATGLRDFGDFAVDFDRAEVRRPDGAVATLSAQEYKLLAYLVGHAGKILSRHELLAAVWGYGDAVDTRTVDVHVAWLRKKLGDTVGLGKGGGRRIETVRGLGYRFNR